MEQRFTCCRSNATKLQHNHMTVEVVRVRIADILIGGDTQDKGIMGYRILYCKSPYGSVIVGVPETPCCVTVATMITPSLAPVAVSVNSVPVLPDITKVPFAFDESAPNTVTSVTVVKLLAPPPSAAGFRQYDAAAEAILLTSCKRASRSELTAPVVNMLIPTTTATPTMIVPSTISNNCCCPIILSPVY